MRDALVLLLVLAAAGCGLRHGGHGACGGGPGDADRGRQLFASQCAGCHTYGVVGTPIAGDLQHLGARMDRDDVVRWLEDPQAQRPQVHMPRIAMPAQDARDLAAYLAASH
jgi:mono/diheme cytochrome c family protein